MANLQVGNKTVVSQTGSAEPILSSNVNLNSATFPAGHIIQMITNTMDNIFTITETTNMQEI